LHDTMGGWVVGSIVESKEGAVRSRLVVLLRCCKALHCWLLSFVAYERGKHCRVLGFFALHCRDPIYLKFDSVAFRVFVCRVCACARLVEVGGPLLVSDAHF
jgi:hypothetical protein